MSQTQISADQVLVRELNLSLVLRYIHNEAPVSRAQIAQATGLNKSTVSSLADDLLNRGLIHETGNNSVGTGRPARQLEIDPNAGGIVGIELGVDFVAVALTDFSGKILWRRTAQADPADGQDTIILQTLKLVDHAIEQAQAQDLRLLGLGLSTPGTVDLNEGVLIFAPNLHWRNVHLRKTFSDHTGLTVFIENDANAAAIAEHLFGAARKNLDFIFVFAGVGIGGGLFLNGNLYRGKNGFAGEIGHSPIMAEPFLNPCHCGNRGCWETYANQFSIIQRIQARLQVKRDSIIPEIMKQKNLPLSILIIKLAAEKGDSEALDALAETGTAMGQGFASLINIFNPEKIILGGPLSIVGNYLLPTISTTARKHSLPEINHNVEIMLSSFEDDASLMGAISIVVNDLLQHPTHVERR
jgi:glucokinase-like ROK family protein